MSYNHLSEHIEENLEFIWIELYENNRESVKTEELPYNDDEICSIMQKDKLIKISDNKIVLTDNGKNKAVCVVRRHRLSELVFRDIFGADKFLRDKACKLEHIITDGVEDNICSLLGHPKQCPHGHFIPPGNCCRKRRRDNAVIIPVTEIPVDILTTVVFVFTDGKEYMRKLVDMGVFPGAKIRLVKKIPSVIIQLGENRLSLDRETAQSILVKNPEA